MVIICPCHQDELTTMYGGADGVRKKVKKSSKLRFLTHSISSELPKVGSWKKKEARRSEEERGGRSFWLTRSTLCEEKRPISVFLIFNIVIQMWYSEKQEAVVGHRQRSGVGFFLFFFLTNVVFICGSADFTINYVSVVWTCSAAAEDSHRGLVVLCVWVWTEEIERPWWVWTEVETHTRSKRCN